jgi:CHAT domain-containing protein
MLGEQSATGEMIARQRDVERRITALRNRLLVRNAEYARDLSLAEARVEPIQPYLANDTLLIEFYSIKERLLVFCVTAQPPQIQVYHLPDQFSRVKRWQQRLQANLKTVPRSVVSHVPHLVRDAKVTLQHLYQNLLAPMAKQLAAYKRLVIVPHGSLHYAPFHALFDGEKYVIETHEVSYLPASSFLHCTHDVASTGRGMLAVGYSYRDRLPHAVAEARALSERWQAKLICEDNATCERVRSLMAGRRVVHLATHGEFRHDNPLFSGLALADGWLTTLDVFNLRLSASLVTLSGCHTGRSLVGGGDELLGLTRAFLAAGAASLVISQWATQDRATAFLMERFYERLENGMPKSAALREAQMGLLHKAEARSGESIDYQHPFFWAPFYLVGDGGKL